MTKTAPPRPRRRGPLDLLRRFFIWGDNDPVMLGLYIAGISLALALVPTLLGFGSVIFNGQIVGLEPVLAVTDGKAAQIASKEVSYWFAPNWAFYSVIIMPFMVPLALRLWFITPRTLHEMAELGLARETSGEPISAEALLERWGRVRGRAVALFVIIFAASMAMVAWDWWKVVGDPLMNVEALKGRTLNDANLEFDWSIACRYPGVEASCLSIGAFGAVAYFYIAGLVTSAVFATCICALLFVMFVIGWSVDGQARFYLFAVPQDADDRRGGFGAFEPFFTAFIGVTLTVVIGCLTMILQNSYLRDPGSRHIFHFLFGDTALIKRHFDASTSLGEAFDLGWWWDWFNAPLTLIGGNFQTGVGVVLFSMTAVISVGGSYILLRATAQQARKRSKKIAGLLAAERGLTQEEFRTCLKKVNFWPVGWAHESLLLLVIILLCFSIFSYRLILLPAALLSVQLLSAVLKYFTDRAKIWVAQRFASRSPEDDFVFDTPASPAMRPAAAVTSPSAQPSPVSTPMQQSTPASVKRAGHTGGADTAPGQ